MGGADPNTPSRRYPQDDGHCYLRCAVASTTARNWAVITCKRRGHGQSRDTGTQPTAPCHRRRRAAASNVPCDNGIVDERSGVASPRTSVLVGLSFPPMSPTASFVRLLADVRCGPPLSPPAPMAPRRRRCSVCGLLVAAAPSTPSTGALASSVGAGPPRLPPRRPECACMLGGRHDAARASALLLGLRRRPRPVGALSAVSAPQECSHRQTPPPLPQSLRRIPAFVAAAQPATSPDPSVAAASGACPCA